MNPWALLVIGLGILLIIMGVKGSYGNVVSALTGKPYKPTTTAAQSTSGSITTIPPATGTLPRNPRQVPTIL